ncbi:MAG TPA: hypothetical protein P5560_02850 [Thermotogota bacterium]|nr:hypothetical protein [Thermotogota bacterium]HRW91869.1 hypothetical protein [Thermotogota bacterium]
MDEEEIEAVSIACEEDLRLREILGRILSMAPEEKNTFKTKMHLFFLGKEKEPGNEMMRMFFRIALDTQKARLVARKIGLE